MWYLIKEEDVEKIENPYLGSTQLSNKHVVHRAFDEGTQALLSKAKLVDLDELSKKSFLTTIVILIME